MDADRDNRGGNYHLPIGQRASLASHGKVQSLRTNGRHTLTRAAPLASNRPPPNLASQSQSQPLPFHRATATTAPRRPFSPVSVGGRANAPALSGGLDDMATGRAAAVYQAESDKWDAMIEAVANDFGLSREQRAAAIAALRMRQQAAAKGAQQLIMDEEKGKVKAYRRSQQSAAPLARYGL